MDNNKYHQEAKVLKAFCDENRLMILEVLQSGEACACTLLDTLNISQSTLSHHMKILCEAEVVAARKEGKWTYYSICSTGCDNAVTYIQQVTTKLSPIDRGYNCIEE